MEIEHCVFPDDILYDLDNLVWARKEAGNVLVIGITSILSAIAGRISAVQLKDVNTSIRRGKNLGTIESGRYFGAVRAPVAGKIVAVNHELFSNPKLANDSPYGKGWFIALSPTSDIDIMKVMKSLPRDIEEIRALIRTLRVRCYSALPDFEMFEIGIECAATLLKLDNLISGIKSGQIVHLVSDDPTADIEMTRWSEQTGQKLIETRKEENLLHFLVQKMD
jgi:glycine cleavage system H lipoate-binding protein/TusA-related sulfurtransferase